MKKEKIEPQPIKIEIVSPSDIIYQQEVENPPTTIQFDFPTSNEYNFDETQFMQNTMTTTTTPNYYTTTLPSNNHTTDFYSTNPYYYYDNITTSSSPQEDSFTSSSGTLPAHWSSSSFTIENELYNHTQNTSSFVPKLGDNGLTLDNKQHYDSTNPNLFYDPLWLTNVASEFQYYPSNVMY